MNRNAGNSPIRRVAGNQIAVGPGIQIEPDCAIPTEARNEDLIETIYAEPCGLWTRIIGYRNLDCILDLLQIR